MRRDWQFSIAALTLVAASCVATMSAARETEPASAGSATTFRRLNEAQYARSIADIFGEGLKIPGRFEPRLREHGLLAIGDAQVVVTPSGIEQYELRAREIAAQLMAEDRRKNIVTCGSPSHDSYDEACAKQVAEKYGRLLFRRPLFAEETADFLAITKKNTEQRHDFYKGLEVGFSRLLMSPNFIFRIEASEPAPGGGERLDAYSLASRLSFLIWDASPDTELLDKAAQGNLRDPKVLAGEVDRMIRSPRFEQGTRSFFSDMYAYDLFDGLTKDQAIFRKFTSELARDAREQSLKTIVDHLITSNGDYRDLFTTKKTFLNRNMGSLYQVQLDEKAVSEWSPYKFRREDPRGGLLTLAAFLLMDPTHEGKTSPTIRGKTIREQYLCQVVPAPPGNVDFTKFQDPKNPNATVRERLNAHRENPTCAGCHRITDPIGLSIENYDGIGEFRTQERGAPIDVSETFDGKAYSGAIGLEKVLRDSPALPNCLTQRVYEYSVGRATDEKDAVWLEHANHEFARAGYTYPGLIRIIATSKAFQTISPNSMASD